MIYVTKNCVRMFVKEVQMTDTEFAKWLKDRGWLGGCRKNDNINEYICDNKVLAIATFKNSLPCSRTIHIPED